MAAANLTIDQSRMCCACADGSLALITQRNQTCKLFRLVYLRAIDELKNQNAKRSVTQSLTHRFGAQQTPLEGKTYRTCLTYRT